jgi:predicted DNA-binding protein YlxM (UPF0122 family)
MGNELKLQELVIEEIKKGVHEIINEINPELEAIAKKLEIYDVENMKKKIAFTILNFCPADIRIKGIKTDDKEPYKIYNQIIQKAEDLKNEVL